MSAPDRRTMVLVLNLLLVLGTVAFVLHQQRQGTDVPPPKTVATSARPAAGVDPDAVLAALDPGTRSTLRRLLEATDRPLSDGGAEAIARALRTHPSPSASRTRIERALRERTRNLQQATERLRQVDAARKQARGDLVATVQVSRGVVDVLTRSDRRLGASLAALPSTLQRTQAALEQGADVAAALPPAIAALRPVVAQLEPTLQVLQPVLKDSTPVLRDQLLPFVQETPPSLRRLRAAARSTADRAPDAVRTLRGLERSANRAAYDPPGAEQGYLFWGQWLTQLVPWTVTPSGPDAAPAARTQPLIACKTLTQLTAVGRVSPTAAPVAGVFDDLRRSGLCPKPTVPQRGASR